MEVDTGENGPIGPLLPLRIVFTNARLMNWSDDTARYGSKGQKAAFDQTAERSI